MGVRLLRVKQVADMLGLKPRSVYNNWIAWHIKYGIKIYRVNGTGDIRFSESDVMRMIESWKLQ